MRPEDDILAKLRDFLDRADDMNILQTDQRTIKVAILNIASHRQREKLLRAFQPLRVSRPRIKGAKP